MQIAYKISLSSFFIFFLGANILCAQDLQMNCGETGYWAYIVKAHGFGANYNKAAAYLTAKSKCAETLQKEQVSQSGFSCKNVGCDLGCGLTGVDTGNELISFVPDNADAACKPSFTLPDPSGTGHYVTSTIAYHCNVDCQKTVDMTLDCSVCVITGEPSTTENMDD